MTIITFQAPDELYTSLFSMAKQLDRSGSSIVRQALITYLQELKEDADDLQGALEALKDNNPNISWEQVQRNCGLLED